MEEVYLTGIQRYDTIMEKVFKKEFMVTNIHSIHVRLVYLIVNSKVAK